MKRRRNRPGHARCGKRPKGEMAISEEVISEKQRRIMELARQYERLGISGKLLTA